MATTLNAGTTAATALNVITDTTGAMAIQTSGTTAIAISSAQVVSLTNPLLPASGGTGITSLGTGVATFLGTPSSANLLAAVTDETGTGALVFAGSPTLTGTPIAPTAALGTNTTQIATTAFTIANGIPSGCIVMWSGSIATIPIGWFICDGTNSTPDLRDRFVVGAGSTYAVAATGGSANAIVVSHTHTATSTDAGHTHLANGFGGAAPGLTSPSGTPVNGQSSTTTGFASITTTVASAGTSGTNANLPPYYALAYIMKG
jgi:hypothetical protein